jgi:hypothetical protein
MWSIEDIEVRKVQLDFSSSGQRRRTVTEISTAGLCLFNAIDLVEVEPTATQVMVCDHCGFPHCSPGGWVAFRRIGDRAAWIPAWEEMEQTEWEMSEYRPPSILESRGPLIFGAQAWDRLRGLHGGLPDVHALRQINSREAARLCQWSAPGRVLGIFPAMPRIRREALAAVTQGDLTAEAECVDQCLRDYCERTQVMELVPEPLSVAPIEFWLDLPGTPGWKSFGHIAAKVCVLLGGGLALVPKGELTAAG